MAPTNNGATTIAIGASARCLENQFDTAADTNSGRDNIIQMIRSSKEL